MVDDKAITRAAARADQNPTDAHKAAGNYRKGHVTIHGMDVTIENARGSKRSGKGKGGKPWSVKMPAHYGYVKGTEGADGDHHDVYVGPMSRSPIVFVIDQKNAETGKFDEHKSMLGFRTIQHAAQTYVKGFSDGKGLHRIGGITILTMPQFKAWISRGTTKHPLIMDHASRAKPVQHFDDGGAVQPQEDDDVTGTVAAPDDGLTLEQLQAMQKQPQVAAPQTQEDTSDGFTLDQLQKMQQPGQDQGVDGYTLEQLQEAKRVEDLPQLSAGASALVSGLRSALPAAAAVAAAPVGLAGGAFVGGLLAPFTGGISIPVGMFLGATGAAWLAGWATNKVQDAVMSGLGVKDTVDRYTEAAQRQHPYASLVGDLAPNLAAFRFDRAATGTARLLGAGIMGAQESVSEAMQGDGSLDPVKIAMAAGAGSLMTQPTRLGTQLMAPGTRLGAPLMARVPGRPDVWPSQDQTADDIAQDKQDAASSPPPRTALGAAEVMPPPNESVQVGNGNGERSARTYPKANEAPTEPGGDEPTVGPLDPGTVAALQDAMGVDVNAQPAQSPVDELRSILNPPQENANESPGIQPQPDQSAAAPQPQADAGAGEQGASGAPASQEAPGAASGVPGDKPQAGGENQPVGQADSARVTPDMFQTPDEPKQTPVAATEQVATLQSEHAATQPEPGVVKAFLDNEQGSISPAQFQAMTNAIGGAFSGPIPHAEGFQARRAGSPAERASRTIADQLHQVNQQDIGDMVWGRKLFSQEMPQNVLSDRAMQERIYTAIENGTVQSLSATDKNFYDAWLDVLRKHNDALYAKLKGFDPNLPNIDPNYMHKMAVGHQSFDPALMGADVTDPVMGARGLSAKANSMTAPTFMALEAPNGRRAVISETNDGFNVWRNGQKTFVKSNADIELGGQVKIGNAMFDIRRANTAEVEQHAQNAAGEPMQYYKNATLSILKNNVDLRAAVRHAEFLESLKTDPNFKQWATTDQKVGERNGWTQTKMKQFQGWYMDPHLAEVFDDFAKPGLDAGQAVQSVRQLSQRVTSTLFWMPVPHALNVFWHWWVGRGWDWINPREYGHLAGELTDAFRSVVSQDDYQKRISDAGAGTVYRSVFADPRNFATNLANAVGENIQRNPSMWDPIARTLGVDPRDMVHMLYRGSQKAMWSFNDVLLTHQIMVNERNGMPLDQAITHAERHIPNYRIPARILSDSMGGRAMSQVLSDPLFVAFGRYHYGVYNSLAHITKGIVTGTGGERREAIGNLMALGMFAFVAKPLLDKMAQYITGNPHAETQPRGPMAPIENTYRAVALGTKDVGDLANAAVTLSPMLKTALEMYRNRDFADRPIIERGQVQGIVPHSLSDVPRALGSLGGVGVRAGEHITRGLVTPVGQAEQVWNKGQGPIGGMRDLLLDIRNPSPASINYENKAPAKNAQALQQRFKKPRGVLEQGYHAITGQ